MTTDRRLAIPVGSGPDPDEYGYLTARNWMHPLVGDMIPREWWREMRDAPEAEEWVNLEDVWITEPRKHERMVEEVRSYWTEFDEGMPSSFPLRFMHSQFLGGYFVIDGHHRIFAAVAEGIGSVRGVVHRIYGQI